MGSNRRQQTINKRNREWAVAEKRALKIQRSGKRGHGTASRCHGG
jgi:hypothetical protein